MASAQHSEMRQNGENRAIWTQLGTAYLLLLASIPKARRFWASFVAGGKLAQEIITILQANK
jgi:hypothetical protein